MAKLPHFGMVETSMRPILHLLLIVFLACMGCLAVDGSLGGKPVWAQTPSSSGSSRLDSSSRDHDRGRSGDRGSRDWRSKSSRRDGERRGDERRSDEKSASSGSSV